MSSEASGFKDVQADASAGVEGPWIEMISAASFASTWMVIQVSSDGTNAGSQFDIGIGGAGSEVEVITDQQFHGRNQSGGSGRGNIYSFPMTIPQGTRISMRFKANETSTGAMKCTLTINNFTLGLSVPTAAQSSGAVVVSSGGLNAYGNWVELIPALNTQIGWMVMSVFGLNGVDEAEFDLGVGSGGNEVSVMENIGWFKTFNTQGVTFSMGAYFPIEIAINVRLAIRVKDNDAAIRAYSAGVVVF